MSIPAEELNFVQQGCRNFPKILEPLKNSRLQKDDMKQVP
jgi:hypothetical protein